MTFFVLLPQQTKEREVKTKCTNCGKKYQQSEAYENTYDLPALCVRCALSELTASDDFDQEPDCFDIEDAWSRSGQATDEELTEIAEENRRYPEHSDDEKYPEWCNYCWSYQCRCFERNEAERLLEAELELDHLYGEAVEEDQERTRDAEDEAEQQAQWNDQIARSNAFRARAHEEWNDSFCPLLYNIFGWNYYSRFVEPVLIRMLRLKKRWRT